MTRNLLTFIALLLLAANVSADWSGKGEAGLVIASGNSETETGNAKIEVVNTIGDWKHKAGFAALYASVDDEDTAERWALYGESDYNFGPKTFAFAAFRYEEDKFSGFDSQATVSGGIGRKFIENERTNLVGTAGLGYKILETSDEEDALGNLIEKGGRESDPIFRGTLDFDHALTETTKLINAFIVEAGSSNTFAENALSLQVKINDKLALAFGYTVRHNTDPPKGFTSTDKLTTINLVYEIK